MWMPWERQNDRSIMLHIGCWACSERVAVDGAHSRSQQQLFVVYGYYVATA